jgi:hypothetical protein
MGVKLGLWPINKYRNLRTQLRLVSDIKGGTQTEGEWEQGAEEDIWTEEGWGDGRMEKIA